MKRLGFIGTGHVNMEEAQKEFKRFFDMVVDTNNLPALRDLCPAARDLSDEELREAAQHTGVLIGDC